MQERSYVCAWIIISNSAHSAYYVFVDATTKSEF